MATGTYEVLRKLAAQDEGGGAAAYLPAAIFVFGALAVVLMYPDIADAFYGDLQTAFGSLSAWLAGEFGWPAR